MKPPTLQDQIAAVPDRTGVYTFRSADGDIIYVANADFANAQKVLRVFASVLTPAAATLRLINDLN